MLMTADRVLSSTGTLIDCCFYYKLTCCIAALFLSVSDLKQALMMT